MPKRILAAAVIFLASVVLINVGTVVSYAAGKKGTGNMNAAPGREPKQVFDAHETYVRYHFQDPDMDFTFGSLALGAAVNHGCEIGEAFRTAAHIKDGDAASWQEEWAKTAGLVAARGERSLTRGHRVSARDQFQRASYYYRLALLAMLPADPRLQEYAGKSRALLKKAGALFAPPLEYFEIPFEGTVLPGFFRKAAAGTKPAKTLIMIGGGETFAEDLVFYIAPQAHDRGYNFLTVDLPGQGLLPLEGKIFRPDMHLPLKAVVDYALSRPEVDPKRLAVYGISGGGGFVPQAAMHDKRIKAVVMNPCVVDGLALFATMPVVKATAQEIAAWSSFHGNTVKLVCWRWGVPLDQPARLVEANRGFSFDPAKVQAPALIVVGEGEYQSREIKRQQHLCLDNLPHPKKKLVVNPASEGAANHCVMENRSLMSQVVFDWLDEVLLLITLPSGIIAGEKKPDVIQLDSGPISGKVEDGVRIFLGIPYAAPPVGELRWKPPQPLASWTQVRNSTVFGPSCPQPRRQDAGKCSEDCLYLNVWTTAQSPAARLPVMVWIHGGAFNIGSGSQPEFDGRNLAGKGVVVVTINYRLGPLGFLVHPLLSKESAQDTSGNYGLLDQIAALQWVQKNIAAFGGDPGRVTIFGESAGSKAVTLLMISPLSAGLFHRAIAQSGGPMIGSEYLHSGYDGNLAKASKRGQELASRLGCGNADNVLAAMRAKSAQELVEAAGVKAGGFDGAGLYCTPVFDGRVLPKDPVAAYSGGQQHDVPLIIGSNLNEGNYFIQDEKDLTLEKYQSFLKSRFAGNWPSAFELFPARAAKDVAPALDRILTVACYAQPARFVAQSMEPKKSKAYLYQFTRRPGTAMARKLGVYHSVDLAYVFGNMNKSEGYDDTDLRLSQNIMNYWVNFANTGNPNGPGLTDWPAYQSKSGLNLEFSDTIHINQHLFKKECDFISRMNKIR